MNKPIVKIIHQDGTRQTLVSTRPAETKKPKVVVHWAGGKPPIAPIAPIAPKGGNGNKDVATAAADPKEIEALFMRMGEIYRTRSKYSNMLVDLSDDAPVSESKPIVDVIAGMQKEYIRLSDIKRHVEKHGSFPVEQDKKTKLTDLQKHELLQQIQNIRSNISKAKKAIDKYQHQPVKIVKYQEKKARLEAQLHDAEQLIRA